MIPHRSTLQRLLLACAALLLIGVVAAACSENNTTSTSPTPEFNTPAKGSSAPATTIPSSAASAGPSSSHSGPVTLQISAEAGDKYDKNTLTVPAGAMVTVQFDNTTDVIHNFSVYDKKGGKELYTGDLFKGPNVTKDEKFTAPSKPGSYYFQCDVHPDTMYGTLVVQ